MLFYFKFHDSANHANAKTCSRLAMWPYGRFLRFKYEGWIFLFGGFYSYIVCKQRIGNFINYNIR